MRDDASNGICNKNGVKELDDMLSDTMGYLLLQEQIMQFLVMFCNYSEAESDTVRRAIGKKTGTEDLLPEIRRRFMEYAPNKFNIDNNTANNIIDRTIQTILDASNYSFSKNHNMPYSLTGYIAGYLRYYHTLEFETACLNTWTRKKKKDDINSTTKYAEKCGITINPPRFKYSKAEYFMDKESNSIYKGVASIKYMNEVVANELYELGNNNKYDTFMNLLIDLNNKTSINSRQLNILILIDYFREYGKTHKLLEMVKIYNNTISKQMKSKKNEISFNKINPPYDKVIIEKYATEQSKQDKYKQYKIQDDNVLAFANEIARDIPNIETSAIDKIRCNLEMTGSCDYFVDFYSPSVCVCVDIITKYKTKRAWFYNVRSGHIAEVKIGEAFYNNDPIKPMDAIEIYNTIKKPKKEQKDVEVLNKKTGEMEVKKKWLPTGEMEIWCDSYKVLNEEDVEELNNQEREYIMMNLQNLNN